MDTSGQWQVEQLNYPQLHLKSKGATQTIAVIDSGISEFQKSQVISNVNLTPSNTDFDTNGHGTMMCSLLLGDMKNIMGIAPEVHIRVYKIVDSDGKIEADILAKAINMAIDDNVSMVKLTIWMDFVILIICKISKHLKKWVLHKNAIPIFYSQESIPSSQI